VVLHTKGSHAEALRQQFEKSGVEEVAWERLQLCTKRFTSAKRIGTLEYHDDRAENGICSGQRFFEINGFLSAHPKPGMCRFRFPNNLVVQALQNARKRAPDARPFSLPYPCNIVHTMWSKRPPCKKKPWEVSAVNLKFVGGKSPIFVFKVLKYFGGQFTPPKNFCFCHKRILWGFSPFF